MLDRTPQCLWILALFSLAFLALAGCTVPALGQQASVPTVRFAFSFPGSQPEKYEFTVPRTESATYASEGKLSPDADADNFQVEFPISDSTRARIFQLAEKAHYFEGQIDSKKKGLAQTGLKTLSYSDENTRHAATYNFSPMEPVQELTSIFQNMATTLEFGRRLEYYHRYQKLALDQELKRMEEMLDQKSLQDLQAIAPILQSIVQDASLINPVRSRAQRLLAKADSSH